MKDVNKMKLKGNIDFVVTEVRLYNKVGILRLFLYLIMAKSH